MISIYVPGIPQPQGSAKAFVVNGRARVTTANPKLKSWRMDVASKAQAQIQTRIEGPVSVVARFYFPRPRSHYGTGRNAALVRSSAPTAHFQKPDADKLSRGLLDALTIAGVWRDDAQVCWLDVRKVWSEQSGTEIEVEEL